MAIHSDMQGPSPSGFHVPSKDEWGALCGILTTTFSMADSATTMGTYLKMPMAGERSYYNAGAGYVGSSGQYWSYTPRSTKYAYHLYFASGSIHSQDLYDPRANGYSIRCFKDTPVVPTSSWTILYQGTGGAGVFWNSTDGLISVSGNGTTWYTIQDKNLGATTVFNQGDSLTANNCGNFYQWGNNYGFPRPSSMTPDIIKSSTQVDASNYGPGNYYSSSTFIMSNDDWSSVQNDNLWGGVSQGTRSDPIKLHGYIGTWHMEWVPGVKDYSAMRGPCPEGYHVPTQDEWSTLRGVLTTTLGLAANETTAKTYLKMPQAGQRFQTDSAVSSQGSIGFYWTSIRYSESNAYEFTFGQGLNHLLVTSSRRVYAQSIRGFKDSPVAPDNSWATLYNGSSIASGAGIFRSSSLGLISISGDGINWITIQDKNLGATTAYNYGDTLSQANCGKYYQWGNNYGFPRTGTVTTSSIQVDASNYGPGNYYSSSTFITRGALDSPYRWDSTDNGNLRGGETGIITVPGHYKRK